MIKRLLPLIYILLLIVNENIWSQNNLFRDGGEVAYLPNLEQVFSISPDKKVVKDFMNEVKIFWFSPETSQELKELIIATSDQINQKKGRPFPDYYSYLTAVMAFQKAGHPKGSFDNWHQAITKLLGEPRFPIRNVVRIFDHSVNLLNNNVVYSTPALKWKAEKPQYRFVFSDSLMVVFEPTKLTCHSKNDSIQVLETNGTMNLQSGYWYGNKGLITWEQSGFEANAVYAKDRKSVV